MDKTTLLGIAVETVGASWAQFQRLGYPLVKPCPTVEINARLKSTAGRCDFTARHIDLSQVLFAANVSEFKRVIIPHEVAHQVAWDVYKDDGHGPDWKSVMVRFGLPPDRCHSLTVEGKTMAGDVCEVKPQANVSEFQGYMFQRVSFVHTNRQRVKTLIVGNINKINPKSVKITTDAGVEWTVPKQNNCNLKAI